MNSIKLPAKLFRKYLPSHYTKRDVYVKLTDKVSLYNLNWDGGSRYTYTALTIDGGRVAGSTEKYSMMAPWNNPAEGMTMPVPSGYVVVQTGHFCGKQATAYLYVNPLDVTHAQLAPAALPMIVNT